MRILIITPNEPFYMANNIGDLIKNLPSNNKIVGCVLQKQSTYGNRASFLQKAKKTYKIFGYKFFIYYSIKYIYIKLFGEDVKDVLKKLKVPIIHLTENINSKKSISILNHHKPDLIISILGNEILKKSVLELPKKGCLNLHTSKLPKYRGMMPTFWAMLNDEKEIGVSVFLMDEGIDTGPIVKQTTVPINKLDSQRIIIEKTKKIGMQLLIESIKIINSGKVEFTRNKDRESSYYSYPQKKDVKLFLEKGKKFF